MTLATFYPVSGFLGAGKTTTLLAAAELLRALGERPAILTNDQGGELVDTLLAGIATERVAEVIDGCFCCRFDDLADAVAELVDGGATAVLAEAVGSCTDLRATVVRPLRRHYGHRLRVAPLVAVVDPARYRLFARAWDLGADSDLAYLYAHQLAEADVIAVNKIDTVGPDVLSALVGDIAGRYPRAEVLCYSARAGQVAELLAAPERPDRADGDGGLDYDRYAAAEAELAWLNRTVAVTAGSPAGFSPSAWATGALAALSQDCAAATVLIGHAKLAVEDPATPGGLTKAGVTAAGERPRLDLPGSARLDAGRAVFNLRVGCTPAELDRACTAAIAAADAACGTVSAALPGPSAFRPAYPRPTHRLAAPR